MDAGKPAEGLPLLGLRSTSRLRRGANVDYPPIDYQDIHYYAAPGRGGDQPKSLDDVDPEILEAFDKLGIPLAERERLAGVAVDAVVDSVSVATTYQETLEKSGHHLLPNQRGDSENTRTWCKNTWVSVVPYGDNFYATLNAAVFQ